MPFIPHTEDEVRSMLETIGAGSIETLFDEIPAGLGASEMVGLPAGLGEAELSRLMSVRAQLDDSGLCFIGAGAYQHHIPAAVWEIATRGEYYTAYTPYQAEASQGTLQLLYEYQSMIAGLMAMEVANASLYDGASGLAEAVLMAVRANRATKSQRILMPRTVHPVYRKVVDTIVKHQGIIVDKRDYRNDSGCTAVVDWEDEAGDLAAVVIPFPNFFGALEDVDALVDWAHARQALVIAVVNPLAMALLRPPGQWGREGADIVCGEGQPLGIPLSSGGPYFGFMCCRQALVRQMPGRIVGQTVDLEGRTGYTLTLQAREQHIRRSKATSNICTNQGLMVTAATLYMALQGSAGLQRTAAACHANTRALLARLTAIEGVNRVFAGPFFHEAVIQVPAPVAGVLDGLAAQGVLGGYALRQDYPELGEAILVCATELRTAAEMDAYAQALQAVLQAQRASS